MGVEAFEQMMLGLFSVWVVANKVNSLIYTQHISCRIQFRKENIHFTHETCIDSIIHTNTMKRKKWRGACDVLFF